MENRSILDVSVTLLSVYSHESLRAWIVVFPVIFNRLKGVHFCLWIEASHFLALTLSEEFARIFKVRLPLVFKVLLYESCRWRRHTDHTRSHQGNTNEIPALRHPYQDLQTRL